MVRVLVKCSHCGAPLDVVAGAKVVACAYCNRRNVVPRMQTIAPQTPADWAPPKTWTPPDDADAASKPLRFHAAKVVAGVVVTAFRVVTTGVVLMMLAGGAYAVIRNARLQAERAEARRALAEKARTQVADVMRGLSEAAENGGALAERVGKATEHSGALIERLGDAVGAVGGDALAAMRWDGAAPYECAGNSRATLRGVTATLKDRTAIVAKANCKLRIIDCTIDAWQVLEIDGNAQVTIEASQLTSASDGVEIGANGKLELYDTTLRAGGVGVRVGSNGNALLGSGTVAGDKGALTLKSNARAEIRSVDIEGRVRGRKTHITGWPR